MKIVTLTAMCCCLLVGFAIAGPPAAKPPTPGENTPVMAAPIRFFQKYLSGADGNRCPMTPSCSNFALQAIREAGFDVPTLCHHEALEPYGACRLCLVEVETPRPKLQAACVFPVHEGLVVKTTSERVVRTRKVMMELLLARCSAVDPLWEMARELGIPCWQPENLATDEARDRLGQLHGRQVDEVWERLVIDLALGGSLNPVLAEDRQSFDFQRYDRQVARQWQI